MPGSARSLMEFVINANKTGLLTTTAVNFTARPTLDDLDAAIDELTTTFGTYRQLVLGLPYTPPTIVDDWTAVFRVPWLP